MASQAIAPATPPEKNGPIRGTEKAPGMCRLPESRTAKNTVRRPMDLQQVTPHPLNSSLTSHRCWVCRFTLMYSMGVSMIPLASPEHIPPSITRNWIPPVIGRTYVPTGPSRCVYADSYPANCADLNMADPQRAGTHPR